MDAWGDTRMGRAVREYDWSRTPLGPIGGWPVSLRTIVEMILGSNFPHAIVWGPDYTTIHNDAFLPILGAKPSALGRSFADVWSEAWQSIGPIAEKAHAGEATYIENYPLTINRDGFDELAFFTFCYAPLRDDQGQIVGLIDTVSETTETVRARETEIVLRRELLHRMKNTMAVLTAVITASLRNATSLEQARESVTSRISALVKAQDLLSESEDGAELNAVVSQAITPHVDRPDRVRMSGPELQLSAQQAIGMSLAVYELATNAVKYGSLSNDRGCIEIGWSIDGAKGFVFTWRETDGPAVLSPVRSGFGSRLTNEIVASYFSGHASTTYDPDGLRFDLVGSLLNSGMHA
jgi:two-component sensor histidine kinase